MNREIEFLENLARAYQTYDASIIEGYLADDMHYASMWVFHEMTSKKEYMDYLTSKLTTLKRFNKKMECKIVDGRMNAHALLVTNQRAPDGLQYGFTADFDDNGKVNMLNVTAHFLF